jgi:hypothetical protein
MPNDVAQQLIISGVDTPAIITRVAGTESAIDFNKIIPMPEELQIEESSNGHMGLAAITGKCDAYLTYQWVKEKGIATAEEFAAYVESERPQAIDLARKYISNQQKFGHTTWWS